MSKELIKKGFTGSEKAYNEFIKLYNEFAEKLESLGADDNMFYELQALCQVSREIYM